MNLQFFDENPKPIKFCLLKMGLIQNPVEPTELGFKKQFFFNCEQGPHKRGLHWAENVNSSMKFLAFEGLFMACCDISKFT